MTAKLVTVGKIKIKYRTAPSNMEFLNICVNWGTTLKVFLAPAEE